MANELVTKNVKIPIFRVKRPHNKVRSGCATCKRGRVKCDEQRPLCTRCHRKKFECSYSDRPRTNSSPRDLHAASTHLNPKSNSSKSSRDPLAKDYRCATILRNGSIGDTGLAKHYLAHTVQTITGCGICEDQSDMWRIFIPAVALTCPVVHQGMLTLAAISLDHESQPDHAGEHCLEYLEAAEAHGKIFVKESRQKLQNFQAGQNTQDQDSILACSRLLCVLGFAFFRSHRQNGTTVTDAAAWTWLHLLRGVKTSYTAVVEAGRPVDEIFRKYMTPQVCNHRSTSQMDMRSKDLCFRYIQQSRRGIRDALRSTLHNDWSFLEDQETEDLGTAIELLYQVTERAYSQQSQSLLRIICTWAADVPRGFVDMLVGGLPNALAIYAHWLMLMILVEDLWWVGDMGRAGIRDIIAICSNADCDLRSLLICPQAMLDLGRESADSVP